MMKKITLLLTLLTVSLGYSQVVLENFEGATPTINFFDTANTANVVADPDVSGTHGQVLELITNTAGKAWQGTELVFQGDNVDLTTTKTITMDVYSSAAQNFLVKVDGAEGSGSPSATDANYTTPNMWQTLTFTFTDNLDNTAVANDVYGSYVFFPGWENLGGSCNVGCYSTGGEFSTPAITLYIDNITGVAISPAETCNDGIQNQDETGVDCGGVCSACISDAPNPTTPNGEVLAILQGIQDTGGFTNFWALGDFFGVNQGEIDLNQTAGVDKALKMDFSVAGWGGGIDGTTTVDLTPYGWLHFDYFVPNIAAGSAGHQIKFVLIDDNSESDYVISPSGGDTTIAFDSWQSVDVPLSVFAGKGFDITKLRQFKLGTDSDLYTTIAYFDNMYFSVNQGTLGIADVAKAAFKVYPNPSQNSWKVRIENVNMSSIKVFDILGKNVLSLSPNTSETVIDGSSLKSGLYFAQIKTAKGINSVKLIKN